MKTLKDIPLQEITLRRYESPQNMSTEELPRKFLLSVGLLQPGESRDIIVDIFQLLRKNATRSYEVHQILLELKGKKGASPPNIRRQLRRLRDFKLVEKTMDGYKICEKVLPVVQNFIEPFVIKQAIVRLREYAAKLDGASVK